MNGVEILNEYAVYTTQRWVAMLGVIAIIGIIVFSILFSKSNKGISLLINFICLAICLITALTLGVVDNSTDCFQEYSHTEYKITIDDSVSMNEFLDKYEILDQEGKIYTVKERK